MFMITTIAICLVPFVISIIVLCVKELRDGTNKNVTTVYTHQYRNGNSESYIFPPAHDDDK